jgi:hypothetical protein
VPRGSARTGSLPAFGAPERTRSVIANEPGQSSELADQPILLPPFMMPARIETVGPFNQVGGPACSCQTLDEHRSHACWLASRLCEERNVELRHPPLSRPESRTRPTPDRTVEFGATG